MDETIYDMFSYKLSMNDRSHPAGVVASTYGGYGLWARRTSLDTSPTASASIDD
jgi:hypothetical protein